MPTFRMRDGSGSIRLKHVIEDTDSDGQWVGEATSDSGWDFWNGNCVGGSSNFMSGYFHRLKPDDFTLLSTYGKIEGANVTDWPIDYAVLEPYYDRVEKVIGVSGRVVHHRFQEAQRGKDALRFDAGDVQPGVPLKAGGQVDSITLVLLFAPLLNTK